MADPLVWGVTPLPEQRRFSDVVRTVAAQVLCLEQADPVLLDVIASLEAAGDKLASLIPPSIETRVGRAAEGNGRVYVDHCRNIGGWNPMFPVYEIVVEGPTRATGTVNFPLCYEGPAGSVNGGFLGVFFDCVVQHHNCDVGLSGGTKDLDLVFRRPTPLLTDLDFEIDRTVTERAVISEARLLNAGELLCSARTSAVRFEGSSPRVSPRR